MTIPRTAAGLTCGEMYATREADPLPLDCHRRARFRIDNGLPAPLYRCGIHVKWYRRNVPSALIVAIDALRERS